MADKDFRSIEERAPHNEDVSSADDGTTVPRNYFRSIVFLGSLTAIGMGLLAAIAGFAFVAPILTVINEDIGPDPNIFWVALVYTLMIAVGLTVIGRMSDVFGRRYVQIGGAVLGTVGSIIGATAKDVSSLIGGMVLIGAAASTQVSYFYTMAELVPMKYRFAGNALMYIFTIPGGAFAPAIADSVVLHTSGGWRSTMYILIAINAMALFCWTAFYFPPTFEEIHQGKPNRWHHLKHMDYPGIALFVGGLAVFLIGLSWGGQAYPWKSSHVIVATSVGGLALIAFALWEAFWFLETPLVPVALVQNGPWIAAVSLSGIAASLYYSLAVVWPEMVRIVYSSGDTVHDGLLSSLVGAGWLLGEISSGFLASVLGNIKKQTMGTFLIASIFIACENSMAPFDWKKETN